MKAILYPEPKHVEIVEVPKPEIKDDEVLLKVVVSGICANDKRDYTGGKWSYPRIGGHEYCGVIEEMGKDVNTDLFKIGDKAAGYVIHGDNACHFCRTGSENICPSFSSSTTYFNPDGISGFLGFSEYVAVKQDHLFTFSQDTSWERMALTEPLSCVVNSVERADVKLSDDCIVIGVGVMGMLHVLTLKLKGARVIVSDPDPERRKKALELGADFALDPNSPDFMDEVDRITHGQRARVVFDTTPIPKVMEQAIALTGLAGTCVAFSSIHPDEPIPISCGAIHSQEKTITGAANSTIESFYRAVQLIDKKLIDLRPLIQGIYPYTEFEEAMKRAIKPDAYKVLIKFQEFE